MALLMALEVDQKGAMCWRPGFGGGVWGRGCDGSRLFRGSGPQLEVAAGSKSKLCGK